MTKDIKQNGAAAPNDGDTSACPDECVGARAGLPLRSSFDLTAVEEVALDITRLVLSDYVAPDTGYRRAAIDYSEENFGARPGSTLAAHVAVLVRMIRRERQVPFSFLSFGCRHITEDEVALVNLLQTMEIGVAGDIDDALAMLAHGGPVEGMRAAAAILVGHMQALAAIRPGRRLKRQLPGGEARTLH